MLHPFHTSIHSCIGTLLVMGLGCTMSLSHAERADRDKPAQIEADRMTYDDLQQVSVFTGNVILNKGTLQIIADKITVKQDAQGYQYATALGKPAKYRQRKDADPKNPTIEEYMEGYGERIDSDGKQDILVLTTHAQLKRLQNGQLKDDVSGDVITYYHRTELMNVTSAKPAGTTTGINTTGRVRMTLAPKQSPAETKSTNMPSTTILQPSTDLTPEKRP